MAKLTVVVKGKQKKWVFDFEGDEKYIQDYKDDGLEVYQTGDLIPMWIVEYNLTKPYLFITKLFNFKNPFK